MHWRGIAKKAASGFGPAGTAGQVAGDAGGPSRRNAGGIARAREVGALMLVRPTQHLHLHRRSRGSPGRGPVAISPLQYDFSRLRHSAKNRLEDRPSIEARTGIREQERSKGQLCLSRWRALRFSEQVKRWAGAPRENGPAQVEKRYPCANTAFSLPPRPEQFRPRPASAGYG